MAGATSYRKVVYVALKISKISSDLAQVSNLSEYSTPIRSSLGTFLGINTGKDIELGCASYCVEARYAALPAAHFCAAEFETSSPWMLVKTAATSCRRSLLACPPRTLFSRKQIRYAYQLLRVKICM